MSTVPSVRSELWDLYVRESAAIEQEFAATGDGRAAVTRRTALVDSMVQRLWNEIIVPSQTPSCSADPDGPKDFALVATGGFGRGWLFPYSDIDILFLHAGSNSETEFKDAIRRFSQELWDLRLKLSPATRTLAECERFDANNVEFAISLLDCRYLAGDHELFSRLREKSLPRLVGRECHNLIQNLGEATRTRHHKFGNTVFHLEPNVKDGPGGLRDYNVANWLALISAMEKLKVWPDASALLPVSSRRAMDPALDFLMSVRCFLHFRHGRHDNTLTWESQDEAAARKIGAGDMEIANAADWMRVYFGHVRNVHRVCSQLLEEIPAAWSSLYRQFQGWRSRVASDDFSVVDGLIFLKQAPQSGSATLRDPEMLLRLFHFMAEHGLKLSTTTEYKVEQALPALAATPPRGAELWLYLQETLVQPHAADALRAMNALRLLALLLPELKGIEALVVRDFYHRYTVDEHSFLAIENLHRLKESKSEWDHRFADLLSELEQPELLYLALLLHDSGKAVPNDNHIELSVQLTDSCTERLDLDQADRETVRYLVANHLEMSAAMRRDVFDPENVKAFAEKVGVPERLKMLCLMTYADIKAVNLEAMTPWKADNLWQLYIACANYLSHSADERVHTGGDSSSGPANLAHLHSLAPVAGKKINAFLEGLPQRYLRIHGASDVLGHAEMAGRLGQDGVQLNLKQVRQWYELTLITTDRPFLFAAVSGALAAWGMNIVKANAFSNAAGIVADTFYFTDRFRTLELNMPEWERLKKSIAAVVKGDADVSRMLRDRLKSEKADHAKVKVATKIGFDDDCSAQSTLLEVITQDRPGLLYRMCSVISKHECNIEIALIETEGQMAIDVLYLTSGGGKLSADRQAVLGKALRVELAMK